MMNAWFFAVVAGVIALGVGGSARGQGDAGADSPAPTISASMGGLKLYTDGQWSPVRVRLSNPSGRDQRYTAGVTVDDLPNLQFAQALWLPANARRIVELPVLPRLNPATLAKDNSSVGVVSRLFQGTDRGERQVAHRPALLPVWSREDRLITAVLNSDAKGDRASDLLMAVREAAGLAKRVVVASDDQLPDRAQLLQSLGALVIAKPSPELGPLQIRAIHQWLTAGGRLWIMLDRVDPGFARRLLGGQWDMTVVDRTGITRGTIAPASGGDAEAGRPGKAGDTVKIDRDYPLALVRVLAGSQRVSHTVDGYPAVLWQKVGRGTVMFTTLSPSAWLSADGAGVDQLRRFTRTGPTPRSSDGEPARDQGTGGAGASGPTLKAQGNESAVLGRIAHQQIGYHVIGRAVVLWVLGLYAVGVLGAGLWLGRVGAMEYTAPAAIGLAVLGAAVLIVVGLARQNQTPTTVAAGQVVHVASDGLAEASSRVAVYRRPGGVGVGEGPGGGVVRLVGTHAWPMIDRSQVGSAPLRVRWDDRAKWTLVGMPLGAGAIHPLSTHGFLRVGRKARVTAHFTERGLVGRVEAARLSDLADAVVTTALGRASVDLDPAGRFLIGDAQRLGAGQFLSGTGGVLSQRQVQRQKAYRRLLGPRRAAEAASPGGVTLWGWSEAIEPPVALSGGGEDSQAARVSQSLVSLAVELNASSPGSRVHIPGLFMERTAIKGTAYDPTHHQWVQSLSVGQTFTMRFSPPPGVRPLALSQARLTLNLSAPNRSIQVTATRGGQRVVVYQTDSPRGTQRLQLSGDQLPGADTARGPIDISVQVKDPADGSRPQWHVSRMDLALTGTITPAPESPPRQ